LIQFPPLSEEVHQKSPFLTKSARDFISGGYDTHNQRKRKNQKKKCLFYLICIFNWWPSWIMVFEQKKKGNGMLETPCFFNEREKKNIKTMDSNFT
jgi:hypothetical protein